MFRSLNHVTKPSISSISRVSMQTVGINKMNAGVALYSKRHFQSCQCKFDRWATGVCQTNAGSKNARCDTRSPLPQRSVFETLNMGANRLAECDCGYSIRRNSAVSQYMCIGLANMIADVDFNVKINKDNHVCKLLCLSWDWHLNIEVCLSRQCSRALLSF